MIPVSGEVEDSDKRAQCGPFVGDWRSGDTDGVKCQERKNARKEYSPVRWGSLACGKSKCASILLVHDSLA